MTYRVSRRAFRRLCCWVLLLGSLCCLAPLRADPLSRQDIYRTFAQLQSPDPAVRATAWTALLGAMQDPSAEIRAQVLQNLSRNNDARVVDIAMAALRDTDGLVCHAAVYTLGQSDDPRAEAALVNLLKDQVQDDAFILDWARLPDPFTRPGDVSQPRLWNFTPNEPMPAAILSALRDTGGLLTTPALALLGNAQPRARALGAALLTQVHDPRALDPLAGALKDDSALVRRLAARALRVQGDVHSLMPLCAALHDTDAAVRAEAALALGAVQDTHALDPLLAQLADPQADVRFAAVWALGNIADARALDPLLTLYPHADSGVRTRILLALARIKDARAADFLLGVMADGTPWQRLCAMQAFGPCQSPRAEKALLTIVTQPDETNATITPPDDRGEIPDIRNLGYARASASMELLIKNERNAAMWALAHIDDPQLIDPLLNLLDKHWNNDAFFHQYLLSALGQFNDPRVIKALLDDLGSGYMPASAAAEYVLGQDNLRDTTFPLLLDACKAANPLRRNALEALELESRKVHTPALLDALCAALPTAEPQTRANLLFTLSRLGNPRAAAPLVDALRNTDPNLRRNAGNELRELRSPAAVPLLIPLLHDDDIAQRQTTAELLGLAPAPAAAEALAAALADTDAGVRWRAAISLCQLGDKRGVAPVLALLPGVSGYSGGNRPYTEQLLTALASVPDPRAVGALLAQPPGPERTLALWHTDAPGALRTVFEQAQQELDAQQLALPGLPPACFSPTLDQLLGTEYYAAKRASDDGNATPTAPGKLADPRLVALNIRLLHATANPRPQRAADGRQIYYFSSGDQLLAQFAAWALGQSGSKDAVEPLIAALDRGTLNERQEVAAALGVLKDPRAIAPLIAALQHSGADGRQAVADALKQLTGQNLGSDPERWQAWRKKQR